jgi:hypothetical protein
MPLTELKSMDLANTCGSHNKADERGTPGHSVIGRLSGSRRRSSGGGEARHGTPVRCQNWQSAGMVFPKFAAIGASPSPFFCLGGSGDGLPHLAPVNVCYLLAQLEIIFKVNRVFHFVSDLT